MEYKEPKYDKPKNQNKPLFPKMGIQLNCPKYIQKSKQIKSILIR